MYSYHTNSCEVLSPSKGSGGQCCQATYGSPEASWCGREIKSGSCKAAVTCKDRGYKNPWERKDNTARYYTHLWSKNAPT